MGRNQSRKSKVENRNCGSLRVRDDLRLSPVACRLSTLLALLLLAVPARAANPAFFWLQQDGSASHFGSVTNPTLNVRTGRTIPLYLWFNKDSTTLGFDGISLDVRLISSDGGSASASITIDMPAGRWSGATDGVSRTDSGGTGVDDCNAFDLTNTDTLPTVPARFGTINITGVTRGTVQVFLYVGQFGIADAGQNSVVWFGFKSGQFVPENLNISGGVPGQASLVPEAIINVVPRMGDFDGDGDVDQTDFGKFQTCLTGPNIPQNDPTCDDAKLDGDNDVDADDFNLFVGCMSGADVQANPGCIP